MAATLKDIARASGYSLTTVSRALGGFDDVAAETRQQIAAVALQLGYVPNLTARRLKKQRTDTLGFIIPTFGPRLSDPFFSEFIAGIGNEAAGLEYDLLVSTHAPDSPGERRAYQRAVQGGWVDGLLVIRTRAHDERIRLLHNHGFPFVSFGRTNDGLDFPFVDEDSEAGMRSLVQHLIDQGHRRIAFVAPPSGLMFGQLRRRGFSTALEANGLEVNPAWILTGDMTRQSGYASAARLLAMTPRPTAIVAGNDLMAIGVMQQAQGMGLHIGRELAVTGFDDIPQAGDARPQLTTLRQPIYEIGRMVTQMLIKRLNGSDELLSQQLLKPELIVRASSTGFLQL